MKYFLKKVKKVSNVFGIRKGSFGIFLRITKKFFSYYIIGKKHLSFIEFAITYRCNAGCSFCSSSRDVLYSGKAGEDLSFDEIKEVLKYARRLGVLTISFSGGEPMLRKDIYEIIAHTKSLGIFPAISTNGSMLSTRTVDMLKEAGLGYLCCSIHSVGERHDEILKLSGTYKRVFENFKYAHSLGIKTGATITLTHETIKFFEEIARITSENDILLGYNYAIPVGLLGGSQDVLLNSSEQQIIEKVRSEYAHVTNDYDSNFTPRTCPAGNLNIYISAKGDVMPCPFIQFSFGNVRKQPFPEIYRKMQNSEIFTRKHYGCPAGQDMDFVREYLEPIYRSNIVPLPVEQHPCYSGACSKGSLS
jgi:MoaA/NifB/PqqE/SkfB family radical SAM enzyme